MNIYKSTLNRYIHKKSEVGKWICKICNKEYSQGGALRIHKRSHEGKQFKCSICESRFAYKHSLKSHMITHELSDEGKQFQCLEGKFKETRISA